MAGNTITTKLWNGVITQDLTKIKEATTQTLAKKPAPTYPPTRLSKYLQTLKEEIKQIPNQYD